jgi:hypothetical protein
MGKNNPPPDFTSWEDDLLNLNSEGQASTSGLDDVLLQLTDINGVGDKDPKNRRSKTAVNAYGRQEGIAKYNKWRTNTKEDGDQFVNQSTSSMKELESLWKCKEENGDLRVPNHDEEDEACAVPPTLESGGEDEEDVTMGAKQSVMRFSKCPIMMRKMRQVRYHQHWNPEGRMRRTLQWERNQSVMRFCECPIMKRKMR